MDAAVWVLRGIGVFYLVGALFGFRQVWVMRSLERGIAKLAEVTREEGADLRAEARRSDWMLVGLALTALAGAAMAAASRWAVALLGAVIVHQLAYFIRQRVVELAARTPEAAAEARPARATVNAFFGLLLVTVYAAWLLWQGVLA